tara:strand:+ start:441 stop:701 length:261 start_codon:yes stop_codon:yes gene_type:complete
MRALTLKLRKEKILPICYLILLGRRQYLGLIQSLVNDCLGEVRITLADFKLTSYPSKELLVFLVPILQTFYGRGLDSQRLEAGFKP